jgi:hypothetical protein
MLQCCTSRAQRRLAAAAAAKCARWLRGVRGGMRPFTPCARNRLAHKHLRRSTAAARRRHCVPLSRCPSGLRRSLSIPICSSSRRAGNDHAARRAPRSAKGCHGVECAAATRCSRPPRRACGRPIDRARASAAMRICAREDMRMRCDARRADPRRKLFFAARTHLPRNRARHLGGARLVRQTLGALESQAVRVRIVV